MLVKGATVVFTWLIRIGVWLICVTLFNVSVNRFRSSADFPYMISILGHQGRGFWNGKKITCLINDLYIDAKNITAIKTHENIISGLQWRLINSMTPGRFEWNLR